MSEDNVFPATIDAMGAEQRAVELCWRMVLIRRVEETLLDLFSRGLLSGTVHTCIGQEGCAVGVVSAIDRERDILFSNHRGHGHYLSYCDDVYGLIAEVMGRVDGVCRGVGGSQHLHRDNFYTNGIQGAGAPIVVGMALAEKRKVGGAVSLAFLGDGTFGEGAVYEAMNLASLWSVPMVFVVEHNRYAQSTPSELQHAGDLSRRAEPFGIPVTRVDGMDVIEVYEQARRIIGEVRREEKPQLLFLDTYRFAPHSKGDDHRDSSEIERYRREDPIAKLREMLPAKEFQRIEIEVETRLRSILAELGV